jgi:hypothetical protein
MNSTCMKLSQNGRGGGEHSHCKALQAGRLIGEKSWATLQDFRVSAGFAGCPLPTDPRTNSKGAGSVSFLLADAGDTVRWCLDLELRLQCALFWVR